MSELPRSLKIATVWLVAGTAVFMAVQAWQAREREMRVVAEQGRIEIRRSADGHYHWPGRLNGRAVEFLVDTGATRTAVPAALVAELGLPALQTVTSQTAGGPVQGTVVRVHLQLEGGVQVHALTAVALPALPQPLLGMDVLSRLRLQQHNGVLQIEPGSPRP